MPYVRGGCVKNLLKVMQPVPRSPDICYFIMDSMEMPVNLPEKYYGLPHVNFIIHVSVVRFAIPVIQVIYELH